MAQYNQSWVGPIWDEVDWQRLKELQVRELMGKRQAQADIVQSSHCLQCPHFVKHVSLYSPCTGQQLTPNSSKCNMTNGK